MPEAAPILETAGLGISFGGISAVHALHLQITRGQLTSVIGPNGAGKSTLFNLVSGALRPETGRILFQGRDVTGWTPQRLRRAGLARSFQITNLFFELEVRENLRLSAQIVERQTALLRPPAASCAARARADALLERFGLKGKARMLAGHLSHGEQRRLEIAMCLAGETRLLLLDEPTQGMSAADTDETAALIRTLAAEMTVVLIEHDMDLVMDISDRVVVMHQGAKLAEGTPAEVRADPAVRSAYLGER